MKRLSLFILILILSVSLLSGCTKDQPVSDNNDDISTHTDIIPREQTFITQMDFALDIFVGKVISVEDLDDNVRFTNFSSGCDDGYKYKIYTIKVEKVYLPYVVTEGTTIKVVSPYIKLSKSNEFVLPLEKGEKYILTGMPQPYLKEPIIVAPANMSAKITKKGELIPISSPAEEMYNGITTLKQLEGCEDFINLCKNGKPKLPEIFYMEKDEEYDWNNTSKYDKRIEDAAEKVKAALPVDSKVKMNIDYDNFASPFDS